VKYQIYQKTLNGEFIHIYDLGFLFDNDKEYKNLFYWMFDIKIPKEKAKVY